MKDTIDNMDLAYAAESLSKIVLNLVQCGKLNEADILVNKIMELIAKIK